MKLTMGQKKALVTARIFGIKEVHNLAFAALLEKGLVSGGAMGGELTALGVKIAEGLIVNRRWLPDSLPVTANGSKYL